MFFEKYNLSTSDIYTQLNTLVAVAMFTVTFKKKSNVYSRAWQSTTGMYMQKTTQIPKPTSRSEEEC